MERSSATVQGWNGSKIESLEVHSERGSQHSLPTCILLIDIESLQVHLCNQKMLNYKLNSNKKNPFSAIIKLGDHYLHCISVMFFFRPKIFFLGVQARYHMLPFYLIWVNRLGLSLKIGVHVLWVRWDTFLLKLTL